MILAQNWLDLAWRHDPYKQPLFKKYLKRAKKIPKAKTVVKSFSTRSTFTADCFGWLAIETRLQIACSLATVDFLALRQSSRAMVCIFWMDAFWKTRFQLNGERGYLSCLTEKPQPGESTDRRLTRRSKNRSNSPKNQDEPQSQESIDWRLMYRSTVRSYPVKTQQVEVLEQRRQWQHNRWLHERCSMTKAASDEPAFQNHSFEKLSWKHVSTAIRCDRDWKQGKNEQACKNCWMPHVPLVQTLQLQSSVISLAVSILREGPQTYITSFELISRGFETPNVIFGYRVPESQVIIDLQKTYLRGFWLVTADAGINAIRPILRNRTDLNATGRILRDCTETSWIGNPDCSKSGKDVKLLLPGNIKALSGKFDVSRMCPTQLIERKTDVEISIAKWLAYP